MFEIRVWFSYLKKTGSGAHTSSYPIGTEGSFPGGKAIGGVNVTTHLHIVTRSRIHGVVPRLPQYTFMARCSVEAQGQLYLYSFLLNRLQHSFFSLVLND